MSAGDANDRRDCGGYLMSKWIFRAAMAVLGAGLVAVAGYLETATLGVGIEEILAGVGTAFLAGAAGWAARRFGPDEG